VSIVTQDGKRGLITHKNVCGDCVYSYHAEMDDGTARRLWPGDWDEVSIPSPPNGWATTCLNQSDASDKGVPVSGGQPTPRSPRP
jgi:hypothetical protein